MAASMGIRSRSNEEYASLLETDPAKAIALFYDLYAPVLFGIAFRILRSEAIAEDVIQDTFIKVWQNRLCYDPAKSSVFTWLLNITRRTAIDKTRSASFRKERRTEGIDPWGYSGAESPYYEPDTDSIGLRNVIDSLEEKQQQVIDLIYFQGFTHQEVHEHLNIPLGTVKSRIRLAMKKLRTVFNDQSLSVWWVLLIIMLVG